jgi:hypothetical protein
MTLPHTVAQPSNDGVMKSAEEREHEQRWQTVTAAKLPEATALRLG